MVIPLDQREFHRILLIKPSSLGDVIHALPVLHGLRTRFPPAQIDWLIIKSLAPLIENHSELNEVILFDRRRYGRMLLNPWALADFWRFVRALRARKYDLVIDLQGLFRTGFLARASGAPVRIGFRAAREGARHFYTHCIDVPDENAHAVDRNYLVAKMLGFADMPLQFGLEVDRRDRENANDLLASIGVPTSSSFTAILPGARWETKRWPAERFVSLIDQLQGSGGRCVLLGGPDEAALCDDIARRSNSVPGNLAGRTPLRVLTAIIARAEMVVCHDSGPMHIAAALNRPLVCITGPTNPNRTGPYNRMHDVVRLDIPCSPCYFRKLSQCPHAHRCMKELKVGTVMESLAVASCFSEPRV